MVFKVLMNLENSALHILLLSILGILWWTAVYGIFDDVIEHIKRKHSIPRRAQYFFIIALILLVVLIDPQFLKTL
jgi:uncharacterized membrane protein YidH (DUF202 family)